MKVGIAIYHKDASQYRPEWIEQCFKSLVENLTQTWGTDIEVSFEFFELNYGQDGKPLFCTAPRHPQFHHFEVSNYADAMNYIYGWIFGIGQCDIVANVNIDDYYAPDRFKILLQHLEAGADIVSSNYVLVNEYGQEIRRTDFAGLNVAAELARGNNIVSNPCHMMKRHVFEAERFNPSLVPVEDLDYWKRCLKAGFKIVIAPEFLHYYRVHPKQSGSK